MEVGPVHLALETGNRLKTDVSLALEFLLQLTDMDFDGIISAGISQLPDPVVDPGSAVIVLFQEIIDDLVVGRQNTLFALTFLVLGRLPLMDVLFDRIAMNAKFSGNGPIGMPLPM